MISEILLDFVLGIISSIGLFGVFLLMLLESTVVPIPSELVMPFAGFLVSQGKFGLLQVAVAATLGSIVGSLISYYIGKTVGKEAILHFGKYFLLKKKHLEVAHSWFERFGSKAVFFCRFVPAIRHVISIPAGIAEMALPKFILYTAAGALCWNSFLAIAGMQLGSSWGEISRFSEILDIIIIAAVVVVGFYFFIKAYRKIRK